MAGKAKLNLEYYPHRMLWGVLYELCQQLDQDPDSIRSAGVAALLIAHNCFEAYLNYTGEILLPSLWDDDRRSFGSGQYRGLMGKLSRLADELSVQIDKGRRPYRTVRELKTWRDRIVHPKIERQQEIVLFKDPAHLKNLETKFFREVTRSFIDRAVEDVEALCDSVQGEAFRQHPRLFLGPRSFNGILGSRGGSIIR